MRRAGLRGCMGGRKKRRTTRRDDPRAEVPAPDLLVGRNYFTATAPRTSSGRQTASLTLRRTKASSTCPSCSTRLLEEEDRRLVYGGSSLRTELWWSMPWREGGVEKETGRGPHVHHSDRGTQYTALSLGKKLQEAGIVPSMGREDRRWTTTPSLREFRLHAQM